MGKCPITMFNKAKGTKRCKYIFKQTGNRKRIREKKKIVVWTHAATCAIRGGSTQQVGWVFGWQHSSQWLKCFHLMHFQILGNINDARQKKKAFQHKQHKASAKCLGLHNSSFLITVFYEEKKIVEHFYSLAFNIFIESLQQSFNQCETGHRWVNSVCSPKKGVLT